MTKYLSIVNNNDYRTVSFDERLGFYTDEYKNKLSKDNYSNAYIDSMNKNELIIEFIGIKNNLYIKCNSESDNVIVTVVEQLKYKHATDEFLQSGFLLNEIYEFTNEYQLIKSKDGWKINDISYTN